MSNHEIEDVLSSIRRLVSEDLRPARAAEAAVAAAVTAEQEAAGKLLLTPALRVVAPPEGEGAAPVAAGAGAAEQHGAAPVMQAEWPVEDVVARLGAAVAEEEWESPFGDPQVWPVEAEPAVARPVAAGQGIAAAPKDAPMDDGAWADAAEAAVRADLAQDAEEDVIASLYAAEAAGDGAGLRFDEEVLRDLVRDLIREELSGTLGERITRNVRKLVRAEIARALALREFE
ncbi:hypothetical protein G3572_00750 [Rhodobacter sp. ETT8]|uniref:Uncharacterized protein n=2 Tax=Pseudotabrizicola algicola TaxID=2709381 RepID=A0A6B3RNR2_9RHOB|nr:hypothetical protein [Pseudotabrizicola algicola]